MNDVFERHTHKANGNHDTHGCGVCLKYEYAIYRERRGIVFVGW